MSMNVDKPSNVLHRRNGAKNEVWVKDGKWHRVNNPAQIEYYSSGQVYYEGWFKDGERHRVDGPAYIEYFKNGEIEREDWWKDGERHRVDGPAYIEYFKNGGIKSETWFKDGESFVPSESDILIERIAGVLWESNKKFEKFLNENNISTDTYM